MLRILILLAVAFCFLSNNKSIPWQENYKLTWTNFQGIPNANIEAAAITASGISFGYHVKKVNDKVESFKVEVVAHFYPEKSWVKTEKADNHILSHEQLHFDITELYSRKLRKAISEVSASQNVNTKLDEIHSKIVTDLNNFQNLYDSETDFSRNIEAQAKWQEFINNELESLKNYQ
jgi:hypothetical protein